ncbi:hypothetical protein COCC4DRAFT_139020 [Bipolaris maydis ATCC 48331]|uniref:Secreted protein n=2 Tax=Cochliobolus heterostrophus TaxID=5016 RepID=M2UZ04_COCH5|nr:uncharacterized protein COCC4DRAFT_139020 [Bipolaris maydis ATCC 48331]EMD92962.1 hypothetical protein COCHEDRAFT_1029201 [Bipolaris maydis C5]ENI04651.1 hypothetical protein COCC4DRAFT_139020 [Bipolaris maydis ATCC 48331]KAJ6208195.1 hypothetical protein PSV09DRAFT_1029201 [Bipolaris maydis]
MSTQWLLCLALPTCLLCCAVLYCTVLYCTVPCRHVMCRAVLYSALLSPVCSPRLHHPQLHLLSAQSRNMTSLPPCRPAMHVLAQQGHVSTPSMDDAMCCVLQLGPVADASLD